MIRHVVLFKFKETANGKAKRENLLEAKARMEALGEVIPEFTRFQVHLGAQGQAVGNYDYILVSEFDSLQQLEAYQKHPAHVAFGQFVKGLREPDGRACIDYEI